MLLRNRPLAALNDSLSMRNVFFAWYRLLCYAFTSPGKILCWDLEGFDANLLNLRAFQNWAHHLQLVIEQEAATQVGSCSPICVRAPAITCPPGTPNNNIWNGVAYPSIVQGWGTGQRRVDSIGCWNGLKVVCDGRFRFEFKVEVERSPVQATIAVRFDKSRQNILSTSLSSTTFAIPIPYCNAAWYFVKRLRPDYNCHSLAYSWPHVNSQKEPYFRGAVLRTVAEVC